MEGGLALDVICIFDDNVTSILSNSRFHIKYRPSSLDKARTAFIYPSSTSILEGDVIEVFKYDDRVLSLDLTQNNNHNLDNSQNRNAASIPSSSSSSYSSSYSSSSSTLSSELIRTNCLARIGSNLEVEFYDPISGYFTKSPLPHVLLTMNVELGSNRMRFVHTGSNYFIEFVIWGYKRDAKFVIVDVDGTITKSSVRGYVNTVFLHSYGYTHEGITSFLKALVFEFDLNIIYLTSRPIAHLPETKQLLMKMWSRTKDTVSPSSSSVAANTVSPSGPIRPGNARINAILRRNLLAHTGGGPVFANPESLAKAAYRELISQDTISFKSEVLMSILQLFVIANRQEPSSVISGHPLASPFPRSQAENYLPPIFMAFGNKEDDAIAYAHASIPPSRIFIIDKSSRISVWSDELYSRSHSMLSTPTAASIDAVDPETIVPSQLMSSSFVASAETITSTQATGTECNDNESAIPTISPARSSNDSSPNPNRRSLSPTPSFRHKRDSATTDDIVDRRLSTHEFTIDENVAHGRHQSPPVRRSDSPSGPIENRACARLPGISASRLQRNSTQIESESSDGALENDTSANRQQSSASVDPANMLGRFSLLLVGSTPSLSTEASSRHRLNAAEAAAAENSRALLSTRNIASQFVTTTRHTGAFSLSSKPAVSVFRSYADPGLLRYVQSLMLELSGMENMVASNRGIHASSPDVEVDSSDVVHSES